MAAGCNGSVDAGAGASAMSRNDAGAGALARLRIVTLEPTSSEFEEDTAWPLPDAPMSLDVSACDLGDVDVESLS